MCEYKTKDCSGSWTFQHIWSHLCLFLRVCLVLKFPSINYGYDIRWLIPFKQFFVFAELTKHSNTRQHLQIKKSLPLWAPNRHAWLNPTYSYTAGMHLVRKWFSIANQKLRLPANGFFFVILSLSFILHFVTYAYTYTKYRIIMKSKYLVKAHACIEFTEVQDYTRTHWITSILPNAWSESREKQITIDQTLLAG